jgi:hypothetical protein
LVSKIRTYKMAFILVNRIFTYIGVFRMAARSRPGRR